MKSFRQIFLESNVESNTGLRVRGDITNYMLFKAMDIQIDYLDGNFDCSNNHLKSLVGCPTTVTGDFNCSRNQLKTLEGISPVYGYLVKTDSMSNKTFLNKNKTSFIPFDKDDVYSFDLGISKNYVSLNSLQINKLKLSNIDDVAYDIYFENDDVTIEDSFTINVLPITSYLGRDGKAVHSCEL